MSNSSSNYGGLVLGLLGILFVGLKLTGYIDWSWWLVTLPFWGGLAAAFTVWILMVFALFILHLVNKNGR